MIAGCPHCGGLLYVTERTWSIVCRGCKKVVKRPEFVEPDMSKVPSQGPELMIPRDDRQMQIWRGKRDKLDRMVEKQKERKRDGAKG